MAMGPRMDSENTLQAGAAVSNITPPLGASLDGPISKPGPATHVHDDLFARCLALSDGQTTLATAVCDSTMIRDDIFAAAKERVAELTGVPAENIMMTATHSHSTPRSIGISQAPIDQAYLAFLSQRIADGVCRAITQLSPARLGVCTFSKPEHLHNRRWQMRPGSVPDNPFGQSGEVVRMNPPRGDENLVEPAGPTDPQVTVLSVQSRAGTPLALLTNYGLHYVGGVRRGEVSADYYGMFCRYLAERVGESLQDPPFVAILANGASGNVNNVDFGRAAERKWAPYEKMRLVARDLADSVLETIADISHDGAPQLAAATSELKLAIRKPDSQRLQWARSVLERGRGDASHPYEHIFAHEAIFLADRPDHTVVQLQAFQIGKLALCAIPAEVFSETGLAIRASSPFELTAVMSLANGYHGYLPPPEQHALGGYETWPARSSCLEENGETKIRAEMMRLLASLKAPADELG